MNPILRMDTALEQLEKQHKWNQTIDYCENAWRRSKTDPNRLLRLMTQAWFLCAYIEQLSPGSETGEIPDADYIRWTSLIAEAYAFGYPLFREDVRFLCVSGILMTVCPEFFVREGFRLCDVQSTGLELLQSAKERSGEGAIICHAVVDKIAVSAQITAQWFPGTTETDLFFRDLLCKP